jgi:hypothetical protein
VRPRLGAAAATAFSMIRKSGYRFSEKIMLHQDSKHDPEKWIPVFRKDHARSEIQNAMTILKAIALSA